MRRTTRTRSEGQPGIGTGPGAPLRFGFREMQLPGFEGTASFAELGRAARDAAGWRVCLDLLGWDLSGERAPWAQDDRWRTVHRGYVTRFGRQAATIGPPAEWEATHGPAEP